MNFRRPHGSLLIFVLWVLAFLTLIVANLAVGVRSRLALVDRLEQRRVQRWLAKGGVARLMNEMRSPGIEGDDFLKEPEEVLLGALVGASGRRAAITRGISNVESKLNLNLATSEQLARLFVAIGLGDSKAREMAAALIDWRDADSDMGPLGAESPYYEGLGTPYACKNAPLERLDEVLLVRGFNAKILADLTCVATVYGDGPVLPEQAPAAVLYALGLTRALADKIVLYRDGEDGEPYTKDDVFRMDAFMPAQENPAVVRLNELIPVTKEEGAALTAALTDGRLGFSTRFFELTSFAVVDGKRGLCRVRAVVEVSPPTEDGGVRKVELRSWETTFGLG